MIGIIVTYIVMLITNFTLTRLFDFLPGKGINIPFVIYGTLMEIGILLPAIIYTKIKKALLIALAFARSDLKQSFLLWD